MSTATATTALRQSPQQKQLKGIINNPQMMEQFALALPRHLTPERFARVACTAITRVPKLAECTQESFIRCLLDLSALGLEPDGRRAHVIPYGKECTLVIDYKGLVELVRRSGDVAKIHADIVCEGDDFVWDRGEIKRHIIDFRQARSADTCYAVYAEVTLKDGTTQCQVLTKAEVEHVRSKSRAGQSGPWVTDWAEMAKKTAFRRLTKWLTLSPEVADKIEVIDRSEFEPLGGGGHVEPAPVARAIPIDAFSAPGVDAEDDDPLASDEEQEQTKQDYLAAITENIQRKRSMHTLDDYVGTLPDGDKLALQPVIDAKFAELEGAQG